MAIFLYKMHASFSRSHVCFSKTHVWFKVLVNALFQLNPPPPRCPVLSEFMPVCTCSITWPCPASFLACPPT